MLTYSVLSSSSLPVVPSVFHLWLTSAEPDFGQIRLCEYYLLQSLSTTVKFDANSRAVIFDDRHGVLWNKVLVSTRYFSSYVVSRSSMFVWKR